MIDKKVELGEYFKISGNMQMTIITLNANGMNSPIKQKLQIGLETKRLPYIFYKKHT